MAELIIDIHCHSTFAPFTKTNKTTKYQLWPPLINDDIIEEQRYKNNPLVYQSDFTTLARSKTIKVVFDSLYSLEQGFLILEPSLLNNENENVKKVISKIAYPLFRINPSRSKEISKFTNEYFEELKKEFNFLSNEENWKCPRKMKPIPKNVEEIKNYIFYNNSVEIKIAKNYQDLINFIGYNQSNDTISENTEKIAVIVTIEGAHSLGSGSKKWTLEYTKNENNQAQIINGNYISDNKLDLLGDRPNVNYNNITKLYSPLNELILDHNDFENPNSDSHLVKRFKDNKVKELVLELLKNVNSIKKWGKNEDGTYTPFFITFSHHFWNQLCGHSISIPYQLGGIGKSVNAPNILDQSRGQEKPFTEVGKIIISSLLSKNNGRRILIDTKHMSRDGMLWYYSMLETYNTDKSDDKKIPIISSHSAVNGKAKILPKQYELIIKPNNDYNQPDAYTVYSDSQSTFNPWDINLSDEEIIEIHKSNGIIGLNTDQRILSCNKWIEDLKTRFKKAPVDETEKENWNIEWTALIAEQIYYVAEVIAKNIWQQSYDSKNWVEQDNMKIWNRLALGSDFDGKINPVDSYCNSIDLPKMKSILLINFEMMMKEGDSRWNKITIWKENKHNETGKFYPLLSNLNRENILKIIDKFLYKNALEFLSVYFQDSYRLS